MSNQWYYVDVAITVRGPVLVRGTEPNMVGVDATYARNYLGQAILPRNNVHGLLKDVGSADITRRLGDGYVATADAGFSIRRAEFIVRDFVLDNCNPTILHRICIDDDSRSVAHGQLVMQESPIGVGEPGVFRGQIEFVADADQAPGIAIALQESFEQIDAVGSNKTVGYGLVEDVVVSAPVAIENTQLRFESDTYIGIVLRTSEPLLLAKRRTSSNLFESEDLISGGTIKGAIAWSWQRLMGGALNRFIDAGYDSSRPELSKYFSDIRCLHAVASKSDKPHRSYPPAFDWVDANGNFAPNFKGNQHTEHLVRPRRKTIVRTEIDTANGLSKNGQLFAYEMILPVAKFSGQDQSICWNSVIDLSAIPVADRSAVRDQLLGLLGFGLPSVGKTKARVSVSVAEAAAEKCEIATGQPVRVVLRSAAIMRTGDIAVRTASDLQSAYSEYWQDRYEIRMMQCYVREDMVGGQFMRYRGPQSMQVLTLPGSVFWLSADSDKIVALIRDGIISIDNDTPQGMYSRNNGFGELALDPPVVAGFAVDQSYEEIA